jgi:hypothetical protein
VRVDLGLRRQSVAQIGVTFLSPFCGEIVPGPPATGLATRAPGPLAGRGSRPSALSRRDAASCPSEDILTRIEATRVTGGGIEARNQLVRAPPHIAGKQAFQRLCRIGSSSFHSRNERFDQVEIGGSALPVAARSKPRSRLSPRDAAVCVEAKRKQLRQAWNQSSYRVVVYVCRAARRAL